MKTRASLFFLLLAAVGGAFWFSASVFATEKAPADTDNVVFNRGGIVIPGTEISKADHEAMNRILSKYDKSLYRINSYENGKLKKTQGSLTDVLTDKKLASELAANVKRTGFTQSAVQIRKGVINNPNIANVVNNPNTVNGSSNPKPGASPNNPQTSSNSAKQNSDELVERLKPILKKYQKK